MPQCDSSQTYTRAVRPKPSPADLLPDWDAGVSEVSRFSCMKFLGVPGVFDYAGLNRDSRYRSCSCCLPRIYTASASGLYLFAAQCPTPPALLCDLSLVSRGYGSQLVSEFFGCGCQTSDAVLAITGFECGGTFVHVRLAPSQESVNKSS